MEISSPLSLSRCLMTRSIVTHRMTQLSHQHLLLIKGKEKSKKASPFDQVFHNLMVKENEQDASCPLLLGSSPKEIST